MKSKVYRLKDGESLVTNFEYILRLGKIKLFFDSTDTIIIVHSQSSPPRDIYLEVV